MEALQTPLLNIAEAADREQFARDVERDPLTILRVATAIAKNRGQWPDPTITQVCRDHYERLDSVPSRSLVSGLEESLIERDVDQALQWLFEVGVIRRYLPEVAATMDLTQEAGRRHKDVWEHTKLVVKQSVRRPAVRWGALLHDIGKVPTRTFTKKGVHFHGHAEVGARMFDKMARRLSFERRLRSKIRFLIKYHLRSAQYEPSWTDSAVRRFHREMQEHLTDLLDLSRADITSKRPGRRRFLLKQINELKGRIDRIAEQDAKVPPLPKGLGLAIMKHFELPASKLIGDIKKELERAVERGELEERREDEYYVSWIEKSDLLSRLRPPAGKQD